MDHTSKGWLCPDLYMKTGCVAGYVCNHTTGQCMVGKPGEGGHLDKCKAECRPPAPPPPPQFVCNVTTLRCEEVPKHGQPTKESCDSTCGHHTPSNLVGLWRGLDIQTGFATGEWVLNFSATSVAWGPTGEPKMYEADVAQLGPQHLMLTVTAPAASKGEVRLATYSNAGWPTGPETWSFTIAIQKEGSHVAPPDNLPSDALGLDGIEVFVAHGCHEYHGLCNFAPAFTEMPSPKMELSFLKAATANPCGVHTSCGMCINDVTNTCGWCDGKVTFADGTTCGEDGNGCCGGAAGFAKCDPGYRKACPVVCDWNSRKPAGKHPFCREATTKEFNKSGLPKYTDCAALNASYSCQTPDFGQYCDKTAADGKGQCKTAKTQGDCAKNPACNVTNPVCSSDCNEDKKEIVYCSKSSGCKGPVSKSECALDPDCDPTKSGCNPTVCKAPTYYTCDASSSQCKEHQGELPGPGSVYFNTTDACKKACISHEVSGIWRGLRVDNGFVADEWDFKFSEAGAGATVVYRSKKTGLKYLGGYAIGAALSTEPWGAFELIITLASGEILKGLMSVNNNDANPAQGPFTRFMYLGLPITSGDVAMSYDDAMGAPKQEFVLIACLPSQAFCDFSSASPSIR